MIKQQSTRTRSAKATPKMEESIISTPKKQLPIKNYFYLALIVIVVVTAGVLMVVNSMKPKQQNAPADQAPATAQANPTRDTNSLISRIAELITVKADEQPTVATIQDAELLRSNNPTFYKDAENGDRLLVWSDKAVLYSSKQDKLLAVMPIASEPGQETINSQPSTSTTASASSTEATNSTLESEQAVIVVKNGTLTAGLAKKMQDILKAQNLTVQSVGDAKVKPYEKTVIIKLSDKNLPATLQALQSATKAEVSQAPEGETGLTGDFAVIVGSDFNQ